MTSQLSAALRAAAAGIHPDQAAAGLIISHGAFLHRERLHRPHRDRRLHQRRHPDGVDQLGRGHRRARQRHLPALAGKSRIVRIAASLAAGHPVSLRGAIPGIDHRSLELVTTAIRHAAGQRP